VNKIVAIEVAIAACTVNSSGKLCQVNSRVKNGTKIMPPPIPKSPAAKPVTQPKTAKANANIGSI
jgi:hypothetical protein